MTKFMYFKKLEIKLIQNFENRLILIYIKS